MIEVDLNTPRDAWRLFFQTLAKMSRTNAVALYKKLSDLS
jgi:hypothetical protein